MTKITVNGFQLRHALIQMSLHSQVDSYMQASGNDLEQCYWRYSPTIDSDSPYLHEVNTSLTPEQLHQVFVLAATL